MLDPATPITPHFALWEFAQPAKRGCPYEPYPDDLVDTVLRAQLAPTLEQIREACGGKPLRILSGWRSPDYNAAVYRDAGRPPTDSQHSLGRAADIAISGVSPGLVRGKILDLFRAGKLQHLGGLGLYVGFVHVDVRPRKNNKLAQWTGSRTSEQTL